MAGQWDDMPISIDTLERFRLDSKRRMPSSGLGAHMRRRLGQSLEFREYRDYTPGDDVRLIDWRASQRIGGDGDWVVRTYDAEEQMTVAITIDPRPSMYLPLDPQDGGRPGGEKIRVAGWIARALAEIAALEDDRVLLHRLFVPAGHGDLPPEHGGPETASAFATALITETPRNPFDWNRSFELNETSLLAALPPASVLVVISDFYFDGFNARFREALVHAQRNYREVVLVRLDSWPAERALLSRGTSRLLPVEGVELDEGLVDVEDSYLDNVARRIEKHLRELLGSAQAGGLVEGIWSWPGSFNHLADRARDEFEENFLGFEGFQSIFAKLT